MSSGGCRAFGCQAVVRWASRVGLRASYNGITPAFQAGDVGSIPIARFVVGFLRRLVGVDCSVLALLMAMIAAVAQLVERVLGKDEVMGSSPISSSLAFAVFWKIAKLGF